MTGWKQIRDLTDSSVPVAARDEVLVVPSSVDPTVVVGYLQDWFGQDDARHQMRIVVDDVDQGVLRRESLYELSASGDRGGLGSGDYSSLAGISTAYVPLHLVCSTLGCLVRIRAVSFDPDDPPSCPLHHTPLGLED
jgi:hypothetical protein